MVELMIGEAPRKRDIREIPQTVVCQLCKGNFDFLPSHLYMFHKQMATETYRSLHKIDKAVPLYSEGYASTMSYIQSEPSRIAQTRRMAALWNESVQRSIDKLADHGVYAPSAAHKATGIPITTLHTAMYYGKLPFFRASILVYLEDERGLRIETLQPPAKLVRAQDLDEYTYRRRARKGKSG